MNNKELTQGVPPLISENPLTKNQKNKIIVTSFHSKNPALVEYFSAFGLYVIREQVQGSVDDEVIREQEKGDPEFAETVKNILAEFEEEGIKNEANKCYEKEESYYYMISTAKLNEEQIDRLRGLPLDLMYHHPPGAYDPLSPEYDEELDTVFPEEKYSLYYPKTNDYKKIKVKDRLFWVNKRKPNLIKEGDRIVAEEPMHPCEPFLFERIARENFAWIIDNQKYLWIYEELEFAEVENQGISQFIMIPFIHVDKGITILIENDEKFFINREIFGNNDTKLKFMKNFIENL